MIDWTKPVQTRNGRSVRVLCTDMKGEADSVVGLMAHDDGTETAHTWQSGGSFINSDIKDSTDLINVPETRVVWVNFYPDNSASVPKIRDSQMKADLMSGSDRIARVRVEYTPGQYDEEPEK